MPEQPGKSPKPVRSRSYYETPIDTFLNHSEEQVLAALTKGSTFAIETTQRDAWIEQITLLKGVLEPHRAGGWIAFEFGVPRVGKRIDVLLLIQHVLFVLEFKVGENHFSASGTDQVWDYALDLRNFHSTSHDKPIVPVLIATRARSKRGGMLCTSDHDGVFRPVHATPEQLGSAIEYALSHCSGEPIDPSRWVKGRYAPTPTIVEAAMALYGGHGVEEISRSDASAINLSRTSEAIANIVRLSQAAKQKSICFVTGVPGAGKTLVGLNVATEHIEKESDLYSVFLSGNGPLVAVLREALARDKVERETQRSRRITKGAARSEVKAFIQNVHHFRDECLIDSGRPPVEHVVLFDEAQRAWNLEQTARFMRLKKNRPDFEISEPEFLISCMDRHQDWAVVVCLVGGGQEIHTGEAGIGEWLRAITRSFHDWHVYVSPNLHDTEYAAGAALDLLDDHTRVHHDSDLHLSVSMRSFRAENVSAFVKKLLDLDQPGAKAMLETVHDRYPIMLTRSLPLAKRWLTTNARGSERYGLLASSQAQRLKPHAIDVRVKTDPIHWFLDGKDDVRSSYYLEDVATEFQVQGLELDWACVVWDGDFRFRPNGWEHWSFRGKAWQRVLSLDRQLYLKNAYRVLLTRARQGMVIVVPDGDEDDPTRSDEYYDQTFDYLQGVGMAVIDDA
jgi:schlafen family protein